MAIMNQECLHCDADFTRQINSGKHIRIQLPKFGFEESEIFSERKHVLEGVAPGESGISPIIDEPNVNSRAAEQFSPNNPITEDHLPKSKVDIIQDHPQVVSNKTRDLECPPCGVKFLLRHEYIRHFWKNHTKRSNIKCLACLYCDSKFEARDLLNIHTRETHAFISEYCCRFCQKNFLKEACLSAHIRGFHTEQSILCTYCNEEFHIQNNWTRHIKKHWLEKKSRRVSEKESRRRGYENKSTVEAKHSAPIKEEDFSKSAVVLLPSLEISLARYKQELNGVEEIGENAAAVDVALELESNCERFEIGRDLNDSLIHNTLEGEDNSNKFVESTTSISKMENGVNSAAGGGSCGLKNGKIWGIFRCSYCGLVLPSRSELATHVLQVHLDGAQFQCQYCDQKYSIVTDLTDHIRNVHAVKSISDGPTPEPEPEPDFSGSWSGNIAEYQDPDQEWPPVNSLPLATMPDHEPEKFVCNQCNMNFPSELDMNGHIIQAHRNRNFECEYCNERYPGLIELKLHLKTAHSKKANPKCPVCHRSFPNAYHLNTHVRNAHENWRKIKPSNEENKQIKCFHCDLEVPRRQLGVHLRKSHPEEKNHPCLYCDKKYFYRRNLVHHIKSTHTKEWEVECPICHKKLNHKYSLNSHIVNVHGVQKQAGTSSQEKSTYKCGVGDCNLEFNSKKKLATHMDQVHVADNAMAHQFQPPYTPSLPNNNAQFECVGSQSVTTTATTCQPPTTKVTSKRKYVRKNSNCGGEKAKYKCDDYSCNMAFTSKKDLKAHIEHAHDYGFVGAEVGHASVLPAATAQNAQFNIEDFLQPKYPVAADSYWYNGVQHWNGTTPSSHLPPQSDYETFKTELYPSDNFHNVYEAMNAASAVTATTVAIAAAPPPPPPPLPPPQPPPPFSQQQNHHAPVEFYKAENYDNVNFYVDPNSAENMGRVLQPVVTFEEPKMEVVVASTEKLAAAATATAAVAAEFQVQQNGVECPECEVRFPCELTLQQHYSKVHENFECPVCDKKFPFYYILVRHMDIAHEGCNQFN